MKFDAITGMLFLVGGWVGVSLYNIELSFYLLLIILGIFVLNGTIFKKK